MRVSNADLGVRFERGCHLHWNLQNKLEILTDKSIRKEHSSGKRSMDKKNGGMPV